MDDESVLAARAGKRNLGAILRSAPIGGGILRLHPVLCRDGNTGSFRAGCLNVVCLPNTGLPI